jgi:hypothetical protein
MIKKLVYDGFTNVAKKMLKCYSNKKVYGTLEEGLKGGI